ncbi:MAG: 16S rRNA (guanine(966)-N(2))-methyltransferase RsmD [Rhodospirillaceae bacterium]|nr:16S rRNA (guanine(966)-N(2))-methyltransferase RsmD [Rhodospirillaceae bacterium]|tara:strand:- start:69871 stop:70443 length:573 start_codon:yes stop_codon:yes gene_type:complete
MRIVGGKHRGRHLIAPQGRELRPTSDRVRESVFNILTQGGEILGRRDWVRDANVLDGFAGTGALGLEAVSRGASHATLFDNQETALRCSRENLAALGDDNVDIIFADCLHPRKTDKPCSLIFLDPPYGLGLTASALAALDEAHWIALDALVVIELDRAEAFEPIPGYSIIDERHYGKAKILFVQTKSVEN